MSSTLQAFLASATFFVFAGLLFTGLELLAPIVRQKDLWPRAVRTAKTDVVHFVVNPVLAYPAAVGALSFIAAIMERITPSMVAGVIDAVPVLLRVVLAVLLADLLGYATHRLFHAVPVLARFHALHHSSETVDWLATGRHHPLDQLALMVATSLPLVVLRVPLSSITLLLVALRLHTVLVHANVALPSTPLRHLIAGPRYHRVHHAQDGPPANFASLFPFIDRLFGTHRAPVMERRFGSPHPVQEGYVNQILTASSRAFLVHWVFLVQCAWVGLLLGAMLGAGALTIESARHHRRAVVAPSLPERSAP